jgi:hypothetical protein
VKRLTGVTPGGTEPRFPGYDVLSQAETWDAVTAGVVLGRLRPPAGVRFFTEQERPTARALLDRLLAQDTEPRVPVLELIDRRLLAGDGDGFRYDTMAPDGDSWRRSLAALDADSQSLQGRRFHELSPSQQMTLIEQVRTDGGDWHGLPAGRLFDLWMRYACSAFYSHPWAWNEIGFGGPAYPRGYANIGLDKREHWERPEHQAVDPIPWADRVEAARQAHARQLGRVDGAG